MQTPYYKKIEDYLLDKSEAEDEKIASQGEVVEVDLQAIIKKIMNYKQ